MRAEIEKTGSAAGGGELPGMEGARAGSFRPAVRRPEPGDPAAGGRGPRASLGIPDASPRGRTPAPNPQPPVPVTVWRSLLEPGPGQRALLLGPVDPRLFSWLERAGVRLERGRGPLPEAPQGEYDFVLARHGNGLRTPPLARIAAMLKPGGRWIAVVDGRLRGGVAARALARRARRAGLDTVEAYYAHPAADLPQALVPLSPREPFQYFVELALGQRPARRLQARLLQFSARLGLHHALVPNRIVTARRPR